MANRGVLDLVIDPGRHVRWPNGGGFPPVAITGIVLDVTGTVTGVSAEELRAFADSEKKNCPVSRALAATPITMTAALA